MQDQRGAVLFFALTLTSTWAAWFPAATGRTEPNPVLFALGGIAPSFWGVVLTHRSSDAAEWREYWRRALDPRRIPLGWALVVVLLYPLIMGASLCLSTSLTGSPPPLAHLRELIAAPTKLLLLIPILLVGGPLAEELGWSGYALDRLQQRRSALAASLILGAVGVLWHLPLFFMRGTAQGDMGFGTPLFVAWVVLHVSVKLHRTWVYNNAARSTLAAILLHFMSNLSFTAVSGLHHSVPPNTAVSQASLYLLVALFVLWLWGPQTMTRGRVANAIGGPTSTCS